jgi:5,6,7,8-tetrahydromethanopterin hydro-lyase
MDNRPPTWNGGTIGTILPEDIDRGGMDAMMEIGEGFVGDGANAAHVNTVLGDRSGPVGAAWANGLAGPSAGHAGFMVVGQPGISAVPPTLFVNKAAIAGTDHGLMTWGPAQAGVAKGVALALDDGVIDSDGAPSLVLIAAVWVNPAADDAQAVFANNAEATLQALRNGRDGSPSVADAKAAGLSPWNPFFAP